MDTGAKLVFIVFGLIVLVTLCIALRIYILAHILGTFKFDNSGDTYRCRMEFDSLDEVENVKFAIVKIREADLSLPGEKRPRD